jgi:hypothetical protein
MMCGNASRRVFVTRSKAPQYEAFKFVVRQETAPIDCVFQVPTKSGGMWRSLHDLPQASKTLFEKKFQRDYLDTARHVH